MDDDQTERRGFLSFLIQIIRPTRADCWSLWSIFAAVIPTFVIGLGSSLTEQAVERGFDGAVPLAGWLGVHPALVIGVFALTILSILGGYGWLYSGWYRRLDELERMIEFKALGTSMIVSVVLWVLSVSLTTWFPLMEPLVDTLIGVPLLVVWCASYMIARACFRRYHDA